MSVNMSHRQMPPQFKEETVGHPVSYEFPFPFAFTVTISALAMLDFTLPLLSPPLNLKQEGAVEATKEPLRLARHPKLNRSWCHRHCAIRRNSDSDDFKRWLSRSKHGNGVRNTACSQEIREACRKLDLDRLWMWAGQGSSCFTNDQGTRISRGGVGPPDMAQYPDS